MIDLWRKKWLTHFFLRKAFELTYNFAVFCSPLAASNHTFSLPFATATMSHTVVLSLTFRTCVCRQWSRLPCSSRSIVPGRSRSLEKNHIHCTVDMILATPYPTPTKNKCWCALNACEDEKISKEWRVQYWLGGSTLVNLYVTRSNTQWSILAA